jgi:hypothetical protein
VSDLGRIKLVLFFTRGVSLKTWPNVGMFEREVACTVRSAGIWGALLMPFEDTG